MLQTFSKYASKLVYYDTTSDDLIYYRNNLAPLQFLIQLFAFVFLTLATCKKGGNGLTISLSMRGQSSYSHVLCICWLELDKAAAPRIPIWECRF